MAAKSDTIRRLSAELERVTVGGGIDRADYTRWLTLAVSQLEDWQQAYYEADEARIKDAKRAHAVETLLGNLGVLLEVGYRAARDEISADAPIEFAHDTAPFRNIMDTLYGLDSVGGEKPKRRSRKPKQVAA